MKLEQGRMAQSSKPRRGARALGASADPVPPGSWVVDNVRLSLFSKNIAGLDLPSWQTLTGAAPQMVSSNAPAGVKQEAGPLPQNPLVQLALLEQPGRADFVLSAVVYPTPTPRIFDMGSAADAINTLASVGSNWLPNSPDIARLAIGMNLMWQAPDIPAAAAVILRQIPAFAAEGAIEDFTLQLNRPRVSAIVPGLKINRLVQWSTAMVGSMSMVSIPVHPGGGLPSFAPVAGVVAPFSGVPVALCIMDINTDLAASIKMTSITALFREMQDLALEIEKNGDVS